MPGSAAAPPRLEPVRRSRHPLVWLLLAVYRLTGVSTAPVRVIFARAPRAILPHLLLMSVAEYGLHLDRRLRALVRVLGSRVNRCHFCDDLESRLALAHGALAQEDLDALEKHATSARFSERERAALRYVEELDTTRSASDATFAALRAHFSEREIVELTWLNAVGSYLNLQARPLGLAPEGACELPAPPSRA